MGSRAYESELIRRVKLLGLEDIVSFTGPVYGEEKDAILHPIGKKNDEIRSAPWSDLFNIRQEKNEWITLCKCDESDMTTDEWVDLHLNLHNNILISQEKFESAEQDLENAKED